MTNKEYRKKKGLTQQAFVALMDKPCSQGNLSSYENGKVAIPARHAAAIRKLTRGKVKESDWPEVAA